ncbi:hypothetical protein [Nostocoides sp. HKS02]|uniref:hypothetical protein n=1 Tax=Nostocoides sp. HKS02 TaxID=1813880 RepID=UPI0012B45AEB|nr:hypothetical protein [Tetrasphaera sp. HKS02]QGN58102.1 hypothetical protein GKE56_09625 [Tetrasphaera sp. HKS02]
MENTTMTIDATHLSRVRSVCPEAGRVLLAGNRGWVNGTTVSSALVPMIADAQVPTYVDGFGTTKDLAFRPFGEPPV